MGLFDFAKKAVERMNTKEGTQELIDVEKMKARKDIRGLIDILKCKTEETDLVTVVSAQSALGEIGIPALEPLLQAMEGSGKDTQKNIIGALGYIGEPAFKSLKELLRQEDSSDQMELALALGEVGKQGVELLVKILKDVNIGLEFPIFTVLEFPSLSQKREIRIHSLETASPEAR